MVFGGLTAFLSGNLQVLGRDSQELRRDDPAGDRVFARGKPMENLNLTLFFFFFFPFSSSSSSSSSPSSYDLILWVSDGELGKKSTEKPVSWVYRDIF